MSLKTGEPKPWDAPRPCRWCRKKFQPKRKQDQKGRFCKPECRMEFYQPNRLPFQKLLIQIENKADREVEKRMKQILKRLERIEKRLDLKTKAPVVSNIEKIIR
jgi:DNA anti-recombination protein RmuC